MTVSSFTPSPKCPHDLCSRALELWHLHQESTLSPVTHYTAAVQAAGDTVPKEHCSHYPPRTFNCTQNLSALLQATPEVGPTPEVKHLLLLTPQSEHRAATCLQARDSRGHSILLSFDHVSQRTSAWGCSLVPGPSHHLRLNPTPGLFPQPGPVQKGWGVRGRLSIISTNEATGKEHV